MLHISFLTFSYLRGTSTVFEYRWVMSAPRPHCRHRLLAALRYDGEQLNLLCCEQAASSPLCHPAWHPYSSSQEREVLCHTMNLQRCQNKGAMRMKDSKKVAWEGMCNCYFNQESRREADDHQVLFPGVCVLSWRPYRRSGGNNVCAITPCVTFRKVIHFLVGSHPYELMIALLLNLPVLILWFQSAKQFWYKTEVPRHLQVSHTCCPVAERDNSSF